MNFQQAIASGFRNYMLETLANPYGLLGRAALEQMKLTAG
jgi:hypothetical protein